MEINFISWEEILKAVPRTLKAYEYDYMDVSDMDDFHEFVSLCNGDELGNHCAKCHIWQKVNMSNLWWL